MYNFARSCLRITYCGSGAFTFSFHQKKKRTEQNIVVNQKPKGSVDWKRRRRRAASSLRGTSALKPCLLHLSGLAMAASAPAGY